LNLVSTRLRFDLWLGTRIRKSNGDVSFFGLHMIGICGSYAYRTEQRWVAQGRIRQAFWGHKQPDENVRHPAQDVYEIRPRKDRDGFDLISDRLRYGPIWYAGPDAVRYAVAYAMYRARSLSLAPGDHPRV
jgi:hypothetical protein